MKKKLPNYLHFDKETCSVYDWKKTTVTFYIIRPFQQCIHEYDSIETDRGV